MVCSYDSEKTEQLGCLKTCKIAVVASKGCYTGRGGFLRDFASPILIEGRKGKMGHNQKKIMILIIMMIINLHA